VVIIQLYSNSTVPVRDDHVGDELGPFVSVALVEPGVNHAAARAIYGGERGDARSQGEIPGVATVGVTVVAVV
jgi:hypothetical protein